MASFGRRTPKGYDTRHAKIRGWLVPLRPVPGPPAGFASCNALSLLMPGPRSSGTAVFDPSSGGVARREVIILPGQVRPRA